MTLDATKVRSAITGAVSKGLTSATAPTGTASSLTGFTDGGYISDEGVTLTLPGAGDRTPLKGWQNGATVRVFRELTTDCPTLQFTFLETNLTAVETYFNTAATQTGTEGAVEFDINDSLTVSSYVLDVVDGAELIRTYIPQGVRAEVGDLVYAFNEPIGYNITIECERDSNKGYNFKQWLTALHS